MLEQIISELGFTDLFGIFWNGLAYIGMALIIIAVVSDKWRDKFFFYGPAILFLYALFYLEDPLLTSLQIVVTVSGFLNLVKIKKYASLIVFSLAIIALLVLIVTDQVGEYWHYWLGIIGFFGIALGLVQLPDKKGFAAMSLGGLLITAYSFISAIWVFFFLNVIFFIVNVVELIKKRD